VNGTLVVAGFFDNGLFHALLVTGIAFCWGFSLYDLVTRDLAGWKKAIWLIVIICLPIAGSVIYLLVQPIGSPGYDAISTRAAEAETRDYIPPRV
jgi:phospholipase D-like protein